MSRAVDGRVFPATAAKMIRGRVAALLGVGVVSGGSGLGGRFRMDGAGGELLHESIHQEAGSEEYEGNTEELAHVEDHIGLEVHLVVLYEFNEEAAAEAHNEENAHESAPVHLVQLFQ